MEWMSGGGIIILMHLFAAEADTCISKNTKPRYSPTEFGYILSNPQDDENGYWKLKAVSNCSCYVKLASPANISAEILTVHSTINLRLTRIWDNYTYPLTLEKESARAHLKTWITHRYFGMKIKPISPLPGFASFKIYVEANTSLHFICSEKDLITEEPTTPTTSTAPTPLVDQGFVNVTIMVTSIGDTIVTNKHNVKQESSILNLVIGVSCGVLVLIVIIVGTIIAVKRAKRKSRRRQENLNQGIELTTREGDAVYAEIAESNVQESENDYGDPDAEKGFEMYAEISRPVGNEVGYATATFPDSGEGVLKGLEGTALQNELLNQTNQEPIPNDAVYAKVNKCNQRKDGRNVAIGATAGKKDAFLTCLDEVDESDGSQQNLVYAQVIKKKQRTAPAIGSKAAAGQPTLTAIPSLLTNGANQAPDSPDEHADPCEQVYAQVNKKKRQPDLAPSDVGSSYRPESSLSTTGGTDSDGHCYSSISANSPGTPKTNLPNVSQEQAPVAVATLTQTTDPVTVEWDQNGADVVDATSSEPNSSDYQYADINSGDAKAEVHYRPDLGKSIENPGGNDDDTYDHLQLSSIAKKIQTTNQK